MRRIVVSNWVSVDGYFASSDDQIDWVLQDPEVDRATHELMDADTMLLGRKTYQMFESFWPHVLHAPDVPEEVRTLAREVQAMTKVVISNELEEVTWENSRLIRDNLLEEARKLKESQGTDIAIFGSGTVVQQLANAGLIDEYLIAVTPVVLGAGKSLFKNVERSSLKLLETRSFPSGNVLLRYQAQPE